MKSDKCKLCKGERKVSVHHYYWGEVRVTCYRCHGTGIEPWKDAKMERILNRLHSLSAEAFWESFKKDYI